MLLAGAWMALAAPGAVSQDGAAPHASEKELPGARTMAFDAVSIRPSKAGEPWIMQWGLPDAYRVINQPLFATIVVAYFSPQVLMSHGAKDRFVGLPPWVTQDHYDIEAKVAPADVEEWQRQNSPTEYTKPGAQKNMQHAMLQAMLAERCKLVAHRTTTEVPIYALVVAGHRTKLKETEPDEAPPVGGQLLVEGEGGMQVPYRRGETPKITFYRTSMAALAIYLSHSSGLPIQNRTGLAGKYDFALLKHDTDDAPASDPTPPSIWDVEALGLKLVPAKAPMETIVIDHIEKPSEN